MFKKGISKIISFLLFFTLLSPFYCGTANAGALVFNGTVYIRNFGAHSIDEAGYSKFDSTNAINSAIEYAKRNGATSIDFGKGRYYAKDICLANNITYFSNQGAELIASANIKVWHSVITAINKSNITIKGLKINGNWDVVPGDPSKGSMLIWLSNCNNVVIENCYLYHNKYAGISIQNNCNYITVKNNKIIDTDCGISTAHVASNNLTIDNNIVYGEKIKVSEPIAIFNSNQNGLAHDIKITNNTVYGKRYATGILISNAEKVLVKGNTVYDCDQGIGVGISKDRIDPVIKVSKNITITENNIYNCIHGGITAEVADSTIYKNNVHDIIEGGITLTSIHDNTFSTNSKIFDNVITNINSKLGYYEPAIRLQKSVSCTVQNNIIQDTRSTVNTYWGIQVKGKECNNNTIINNTNTCPLVKGGRSVYIQNALDTNIINNKGTILNDGFGTKIRNDK